MTDDLPEFTRVICPWLEKEGDDPYTFARDGFCTACGGTNHDTW